MERTLVLVKPDGVQRGLIGNVIGRFESKGFKVIGLKLLHLTRERAANLYSPHEGKNFYPPLLEYMTSGAIVAMALEGDRVIMQVRTIMGATDPAQAAAGTIRGDFGQRVDRNIVHGSADAADAARELPIFFSPEELVPWDQSLSTWL